MKNKKQYHKVKIATCWRFVAGDCNFSDQDCWFNHCKNKLEDIDEIECIWCEKIFMTQPEFLNHRKKEHKEHVPMCRNVSCAYIGCILFQENEQIDLPITTVSTFIYLLEVLKIQIKADGLPSCSPSFTIIYHHIPSYTIICHNIPSKTIPDLSDFHNAS